MLVSDAPTTRRGASTALPVKQAKLRGILPQLLPFQGMKAKEEDITRAPQG